MVRRMTLRNQLIDRGGAGYVVRHVRNVEVDTLGVARGHVTIGKRQRTVEKRFTGSIDPEDLTPWSIRPVWADGDWFAGPLIGVVFGDDDVPWSDEPTDPPETDEEFYAWLDSLEEGEIE